MNIAERQIKENTNHELYEEDSLELNEEIRTQLSDSEFAESQSYIEELLFPEGQFVIKKFIARGGEGKVYVAEDVVTKDLVAIKQYEAQVQDRDNLFSIISKEARLMKSFCHPNIVKCFGLYVPEESTDGMTTVSIIMEYVEGGSLADRLKSCGKFPLNEIKDIIKDVLEGLIYLHGLNVIYRDIKPSNVLIGDLYKITDFGISTQIRDNESIPRSCTGTP